MSTIDCVCDTFTANNCKSEAHGCSCNNVALILYHHEQIKRKQVGYSEDDCEQKPVSSSTINVSLDECKAAETHVCVCTITTKCRAQTHACVCTINNNKCLASQHFCLCDSRKIISPPMYDLNSNYIHKKCQADIHDCLCVDMKPRNKHLKCQAKDHICICIKFGVNTNKCYAEMHDCTCLSVGPYMCQASNYHKCICKNLRCKSKENRQHLCKADSHNS